MSSPESPPSTAVSTSAHVAPTSNSLTYLSIIAILLVWGIAAPIAILWHHIELPLRTIMANETTHEFEYQLKGALESGSADMQSRIESIRGYYPSGTKQVTGTSLDQIVERCRKLNIEYLELVEKYHKCQKGQM